MTNRADAGSDRATRTPFTLSLLLWYVALVGWLTLQPFGGGAGAGTVNLSPQGRPLEVVGNLLLFAPVGLGVATIMRGAGRLSTLLTALLLVGLLSASVECTQWFVRGRDVSPYDFALNTLGGGGASALGHSLFGRRPARIVLHTSLVAIWAIFAMGAVLATIREGSSMQLEGWNSRFPVRAGDEVGGGRPYTGEVRAGLICAGEGSAESICIAPGADTVARRQLVARAHESQVVLGEATVLSESSQQTGPARILTFSRDPYVRNFTLAQRGRHLVLRIRTPMAGQNGTRSQYLLTDAVPVGVVSQIQASYEKGTVALTVETDETRVGGVYTPGVLLSWIRQRPVPFVSLRDVDLRYVSRIALATAIVLFLPVGILLSAGSRLPLPWSSVTAPAVAAGFLGMADVVLTETVEPRFLIYAAVAALAGSLLPHLLEGPNLRGRQTPRGTRAERETEARGEESGTETFDGKEFR